MIDAQPLNRRIEVLIGPLPEWKGGGAEEDGVKIVADGTPNAMRIKFSVPKHVVSTSSPTVISLFNMTREFRKTLQTPGLRVVLKAGWENTGIVDIFRGGILGSVNSRQGADIVTNLMCLSGFSSTARTVVSLTFAGGISLTDVVTKLAKSIPGITVNAKSIKLRNTTIGSQGFSYAGPVSDSLNKLARVHGFNWWINGGIFHALDDGYVFPGGRVLISSNNGFLLRAEPILATPFQQRTGVSIQSLFSPYVEPGNEVQLESAMNPQINGNYVVHTMSHAGDSHSNEWETRIESLIVVN